MLIKVFQKFLPLFSNNHIDQSPIGLASVFLYQGFLYQPVDDPAGIAHFIKHPFPDLQGG